jgi:hypothetical protein
VDKALLERVAAEIMGWTVLDKPAELAQAAGMFFFIDDETNRPIRARTFAFSPDLLEPDDPPYGLSWKVWNPFAEAWTEIVKAICDKGFLIDLRFGADEDTVKVSTQDGYHSVSGSFTGDATPGRALCEAALLLMDRTRNLLEVL